MVEIRTSRGVHYKVPLQKAILKFHMDEPPADGTYVSVVDSSQTINSLLWAEQQNSGSISIHILGVFQLKEMYCVDVGRRAWNYGGGVELWWYRAGSAAVSQMFPPQKLYPLWRAKNARITVLNNGLNFVASKFGCGFAEFCCKERCVKFKWGYNCLYNKKCKCN